MAKKRKKSKASAAGTKNFNRQLTAVILFAVAVFSMCVVVIPGNNLWNAMKDFTFGLLGITAFVYPVFLGAIAVVCAIENKKRTVKAKLIEIGILIWLVGVVIDIFAVYNEGLTFADHIVEVWKAGGSINTAIKGGGILGAFLSHPIGAAFGRTPAAITIIILIFVFLMIITGTTLIALFKAIAKPVKAVSEQVEDAYKTRAEKHSAESEKGEKKPKIKVIKNFEVDIPVDDIPEKRERDNSTLGEKQKKLVDTYYDEEDASDEIITDDTSADLGDAIEATKQEAEEKTAEEQPQKITVDFEKETGAVTKEIEKAPQEKHYKFPPLNLLKATSSGDAKALARELDETAEHLVATLKSFGVETRIVDISKGPTVTRYELQPCAGVKISKITGLADDIALSLAAAGVRIEAPIPNKAAVGIEVPNKASAIVGIREIIESPAFTASKSKLTVAMGKDIGGNVVVADVAKMPHGLIAGATGSGKSVCINSIIMSILYKASPEEVKLLMIDPKVVELGVYNGIPHLLIPVVTEPRKAAGALGWAVSEMEKRYQMFADRSVRDIEGYNKFVEGLIDEPEVKKMPHIVIIIDELADLMMTAPSEVEDSINRIAAKARAAGIHLLIATQRPSVNVVTGVIKANIPSRIAFAVSSQIDSRTILDSAGAEKLLGRGDMLFSPIGSTKPKRLQGCFVSDEEVERVVGFVKTGSIPDYDDNIMVEIERQAAVEKQKKTGLAEDAPEEDPMLDEAIKVVVEQGLASTSLLQRKLKLGYARAARIVDEMEQRGVVGPYEGSKPRKVLITREQLLEKEAGE